jgi:hypothetical protein
MQEKRRRIKFRLGTAIVAFVFLAITLPASLAVEPAQTEREFIELQTSINSIMVAVVDWAAHEIWEAGYADTLTGRNWLTTKQYAIQLLASGTLVSLGGTGKADQGWSENPDWQLWTSKMIEETRQALLAIDAKDQAALRASGNRLVEACEGCHSAFKPQVPTEGILHVPHHDYGDSLTQ